MNFKDYLNKVNGYNESFRTISSERKEKQQLFKYKNRFFLELLPYNGSNYDSESNKMITPEKDPYRKFQDVSFNGNWIINGKDYCEYHEFENDEDGTYRIYLVGNDDGSLEKLYHTKEEMEKDKKYLINNQPLDINKHIIKKLGFDYDYKF